MPPSAPSAARDSASLLSLQMTAFCLLWSFAFVAGKVAITDCPPLVVLTARFLLAALLVLAVPLLRRERWTLSAREMGSFAVIGIANNAIYLGLGYTALRTVSVGLSTLIVSATPIVTAVLAALVLGESLTARKVLGLLLGIGGVALVVAHRLSVGSDSLQGILLTFGAMGSLVAGTILFRKFAPSHELWTGNGVQNLAAGLALAPFALASSGWSDIAWTPRLLWAFAYLVLVGSMLTMWLWFHLLKVCGATVASSLHFLMPPLGMVFAYLVLGEHIVALDLLGVVPVALGIYLVTRAAPARGRKSWLLVRGSA